MSEGDGLESSILTSQSFDHPVTAEMPAGPIFDDEFILYATLNLEEIDQESMTLGCQWPLR